MRLLSNIDVVICLDFLLVDEEIAVPGHAERVAAEGAHARKELADECLDDGREQHELVLLYDLLFKVRPNTLVLIDEPELSLHISWQKTFLDDLLQIIRLAKFDVIMATHSPYIVGDRSDLLVVLSSSQDE